MAQFLYFFPNFEKQSATEKDFVDAGLEYAIGSLGIDTNFHTTAGPGGAAGLCSTCNTSIGKNPPAQYQPDKQTWRKGPDGRYWVGVWNDAKPTPAELARARQYDGQAVRMLDGGDWIVPRCYAVLPDREASLPVMLDVADDGKTMIQKIHPRYRKLCEGAFRWWLDYSKQSAADAKMKTPELIDLAVSALGVNYRVGLIETVALLGLWSTDEFTNVLRAMIDADAIDEYAATVKATPADESKKIVEPAPE